MGFSRQEYWSGFSCPPPGDIPNPGVEPVSLMSPALAGSFFTTNATWEAITHSLGYFILVSYAALLKVPSKFFLTVVFHKLSTTVLPI